MNIIQQLMEFYQVVPVKLPIAFLPVFSVCTCSDKHVQTFSLTFKAQKCSVLTVSNVSIGSWY